MTDTNAFLNEWKKSGLKLTYLAKCLSLTPDELHKKIYNISEFKASEIQACSDLLNLTREKRHNIFFCNM